MFDADELTAATVFNGNWGLGEATAFECEVAVVAPLPDDVPTCDADADRRMGDPRRDNGDKLWNSGRPLAPVGDGPAIGVAGAVADDAWVVTWEVVKRGVPGAEEAGEEVPPPRKNWNAVTMMF